MTDQEVWEFFKAGKGKKKKLEELRLRLRYLENEDGGLKAIDYEKPSISGGTISDLSEAVIRSEESRARVKKAIAEMQVKIFDWQEQALSMIHACENDMQAGILIAKFINEKSWREIQKEYHYSESQPYVICRRAIEVIACKYKPVSKENRKQ